MNEGERRSRNSDGRMGENCPASCSLSFCRLSKDEGSRLFVISYMHVTVPNAKLSICQDRVKQHGIQTEGMERNANSHQCFNMF